MWTKVRYREEKRLFRKSLLVIQVGTITHHADSDDIPPSMRDKEIVQWRDAEVTDLDVLGA